MKTPMKDSDLSPFWELAFENIRNDYRIRDQFTLDENTIITHEDLNDTRAPELSIWGTLETAEGKLLTISFSVDTLSSYVWDLDCTISN